MPQYGSAVGGFGPPNPALAALLNRPSNPSDEELDQYAAQQNRPYWRCELQWYGPASVIATQMEYAKARLRAIPGAAFTDGPLLQFPLTAEQLDRVHKVAIGVPNMAIFSILVAVFFAFLTQNARRDRVRVTLIVGGSMIVLSLIVAYVMFPFPLH